MTLLLFTAFFLVIDFYVFQGIVTITKNIPEPWRSVTRYGFWLPTIISVLALAWWMFDDPYKYSANFRNWVITALVATYFSKLFAVVILMVDDLQRGVRWAASFFSNDSETIPGQAIPRSEFLARTALIAASVPFGTMAYGIISGAHDYRIRRLTVKLPNLPKSFDGITIAQISDIHSGSFFNKTAVMGGVEMVMKEKPDAIFFTGDLVNNEASEVKDYINVFNKLNAPLGVFSVTGNHDYGRLKNKDLW